MDVDVPALPETNCLDENNTLLVDDDREPSAEPSSRVTVEEVDDEDEDEDIITVEPCTLSPEARAEEGLDELPWDPSAESFPSNSDPPVFTAPTSAHLIPK
ncbi:hypothetical protein B0H14DRAFT_3540934 [Mycena olivaceomarginata]|nr:hypothetical protein B0H14DRAFT_3540934 [Mycena olivaceomarginata]